MSFNIVWFHKLLTTFRREFLPPSSDQRSATRSYNPDDHGGVNVRSQPDHPLTIWLPASRSRRSTVVGTAVAVMYLSDGGTLECVQTKLKIILTWCLFSSGDQQLKFVSLWYQQWFMWLFLLPDCRRFCGFRFLSSEILERLILKDPKWGFLRGSETKASKCECVQRNPAARPQLYTLDTSHYLPDAHFFLFTAADTQCYFYY
jgi:hypothetical protein